MGGRYLLVARLGSGGFGHVWQARDTVLDVDVAVKQLILPPGLPEQERAERLARARREAANAARLRGNPGIVSLHDIVLEDGEPWLIMEFIAGRSLAELLEARGPLPAASAVRVARAVLSALAACHAAGIVHRDVKPANVMLTDDGRVVLTDFGISMVTSDSGLTGTGQFVGSVDYIAPERIKGERALPASDLFSLGALLYHAVEGTAPFRRDAAAATIGAVLFQEPPPPARAEQLAPLIAALLSKDPGNRPSAEQALRLLDAQSAPTATLTVQAGPPAGLTGPPPARRRRSRWIALSCGAIVLAGALATGLVLSLDGSGAPLPLASWPGPETFNGTSTQATLPGSALSTGAGASFTVSAWVDLTSTRSYATAVSQDGAVDSSFYLQYSAPNDAWAFARTTTGSGTRVVSRTPPVTGQWTRLTGVYNASDDQATLYVNGVMEGTARVGVPVAGHGNLIIGRARFAGGPTDWFPGMIKDVQAFQTALTASQVKALH